MNLIASIFLLLTCVCLVNCTKGVTPEIYNGGMSYPVTVINLGSDKKLIHKAGKKCDNESRPMLGSEGDRTYSEWLLADKNGDKLGIAPSMLSDPKHDETFGEYYRENDDVTIYESGSRNTILIIEDRSPTFPNRAYIVIKQGVNGWSAQILDVDSAWPESVSLQNRTAISKIYPKPTYLDDSKIILNWDPSDSKKTKVIQF